MFMMYHIDSKTAIGIKRFYKKPELKKKRKYPIFNERG
jgi:hypothetical protein